MNFRRERPSLLTGDEQWFFEAITQGIKKAIERAKREGLAIGQTVCHESFPFHSKLKSIHEKGGMRLATIEQVTTEWGEALAGAGETRDFPLDELYDPRVAAEEIYSSEGSRVGFTFTNALIEEGVVSTPDSEDSN